MVSKAYTLSFIGLDVYPVEIEVDLQRGLPSFSIIGLGDTRVKESKDRVRASVKNSGYIFPAKRITVNLAPANIKKEGTHFDLAIALALLDASSQIDLPGFKDYAVLGELSLEGMVRAIRGVFPMALKSKERGKKVLLPSANAQEAALAQGLEVYPVRTLKETIDFLSGKINLSPVKVNIKKFSSPCPDSSFDFSDVKGQVFAKRAMEVAVSGMHNILLIGPPGVGKTMLARRIPTILPDMDTDEIMETTKIYSVSGMLERGKYLVRERPFRSPHHTCSGAALVGGGKDVSPGEISLAHNGVLFMDELPEFSRYCLESLRQPLEDGQVNIARADRRISFPSRFLLVSAMNPCPCGYFGSDSKPCHCSSYQIRKYRNKISGPLLDRIDLHVPLINLKARVLMADTGNETVETSAKIKQRVTEAQAIQRERFKGGKNFFNAGMTHKQIKKYCVLTAEASKLVQAAIREFEFSPRVYDKVLKISRTIADLAREEFIKPEHIAEAVQYRSLDKNLWV